MSDPFTPTQEPISMDEGVNVLLTNVQQTLREGYHQIEQRIRRSPISSVISAVLAGYSAHRLPLKAIAVTQVRIVAALAPPALFLFGAAKVYEFLQRQQSKPKPTL